MNKVIEYLRALPENSGQIVEINTSNGVEQFYFMWFKDEKHIDLKPVDNINIISIHERCWDRLRLIF